MAYQVDQSKVLAESKMRRNQTTSLTGNNHIKERTMRPVIQILRLLTGKVIMNDAKQVEENPRTYISKHELRSICGVRQLQPPHILAITHALTIAPTTACEEMKRAQATKKTELTPRVSCIWIRQNVNHDKQMGDHFQLTMKDLYTPNPRQITIDSHSRRVPCHGPLL